MTRSQKSVLTRAIKRFERAVDDKAFEGTIPYDSEATLQEHDRIDRAYETSRAALIRLYERLAS